MNRGDGSFDEVIALPGGVQGSASIKLGDIDNDGFLDIVLGSYDLYGTHNQLLVNKGNDGFFDEAIPLPGGNLASWFIAVGDVDNDGFLDIIVANQRSENQLLMNRGDGSFDEAIVLPGGVKQSMSIYVADINNDGWLDIVVGNGYFTLVDGSYPEENQLLINQGNGSFNEAIVLPGGKKISPSISLGDVDNDGWLDIVVGNILSDNQLLINQGGGSFDVITLPGGTTDISASISLGDVDNDGWLDIAVGNLLTGNKLIMNQGDGSYIEAMTLPGGARESISIALGDVDNDGWLDIVVGNGFLTDGAENQLLMNRGDGSFDEANSLPGGSQKSSHIIVGDVDNDGFLDMVVGNIDGENQLLLNRGNGSFYDTIALPGDIRTTTSMIFADIDNDGFLDLVVGNEGSENQVISYSTCRNGGARLHSKSWCFKCPSFMGQGLNSPFCIECIPDFISGGGELCDLPCTLGERQFGQDICTECTNGTFYDNSFQRQLANSESWLDDRCVDCPPGTFANDNIAAIDKCFSCTPGFYQPDHGGSECIKCPLGYYQPDFQQTLCLPCDTGGYCNAISSANGGFTPCSAGTYNSFKGNSTESSCIPCDTGTYTDRAGMDTCLHCPAGKYASITGKLLMHFYYHTETNMSLYK